MIAACYSNPNWDGKDNANKRKEYIEEMNEHFDRAIEMIYAKPGEHVREADVDWDNPFYAAHKREIEKTRERFAWATGKREMSEVLEQEQQRDNGRAQLDQIPRNT